MEEIKILEVIPTLKSGGAERLVMDLVLALNNKQKVKVEVLTLFNSKEEFYYQTIIENKVAVKSLNKKKGFDINCLINTFKIVKNSDVDIIHCHLNTLKYLALPCILYKKKLVYTIHNLAEKDAPGIYRIIYKYLFKNSNIIPVAICNNVKKSAISYYGKLLNNLPIVFNGVNIKEIVNSNVIKEYKEDISIKFLCVATFKEQKNHKYLIDIFEKIALKYENVKLFLAGEGILKESIKNYVREKKIEDKVIFLGDRSDIYSLMNSMDVFILTSKYEGFSISILEAMAARMKIIVSNVGGNGEQILDDYNGILFDLEDPNKILVSLDKLLENDKYNKNAYNRVIELFDINVTAKQYLELFSNINN
ncbi:MAG: glycosyltransferase family 4 protein [Zhenhengia sp.]|uniref:glycosyltransferase family 4 protein n=1 Tax=Zhenhengia sp. TaxID=2944208 RepID=UPI0039922682